MTTKMKVILRAWFMCGAVVPLGARGQAPAPADPVGPATYAAAPGLGGGFIGDARVGHAASRNRAS
jgi:hypothetical protein